VSRSSAAPETLWQRCTPSYVKTLPVLDFPFEQLPDIYAPAKTVLRFAHGSHLYAFQWCFLRRQVDSRGVLQSVDVSSLSEARVKAMPEVMERLSKWFRFNNARSMTVEETSMLLGRLLFWADQPMHAGRYVEILSNSDIALEALKGYHTHLRSRLQSHLLHPTTAASLDQKSIPVRTAVCEC
jgi:hypothetical protein